MAREEKKERIIRQREEQILDAALAVFSEKGFGVATIPDIATEAGLAVGTIYNYFPSKHELLLTVIKKFLITESFLDLFEHALEKDFPSFIAAILENRLAFVEKGNDRKLLFLMSEVLRDGELKDMYNQRIIKPIMTKMEEFYSRRSAEGYFRPLKAPVITRTLAGMVIGLLIMGVLEGESSPLSKMTRQELLQELTNLIMNGLGNREN